MRLLRYFLFAAITLGLLPSAFAKDKDHDKGKDHRESVRDRDRDRDDRGQSSSRPPGWDKGKKTGWGDCNVPPGQAKKSGCNSTAVRHDHDRDRDRDARHVTTTHHVVHHTDRDRDRDTYHATTPQPTTRPRNTASPVAPKPTPATTTATSKDKQGSDPRLVRTHR
jgi:hypothetical protein